jgi:hypothetical protein
MENVNITASVGRGGKNLPNDVLKIQELLNEHLPTPMLPLVVDGACGPSTITAIEDFQRRVLGIRRPDGKVDPQGATMAALSPVALTRSPEVLVPYLEGHGLYVKSSGSKKLFGTPKTIQSLQNLAHKVAERLGASVGIVEISAESGGNLPPHKSHRRGVDVDIRPLRSDGKTEGVSISDAAYSRELTEALVGYLYEDPNVQFVLFNDTQIARVQYSKGHNDHLHVRFKE